MLRMALKPKKQKRIVKAIWKVMEEEGVCDSYRGSEFQRCEPIVIDFVNTILKECNEGPTEEEIASTGIKRAKKNKQ